MQIRVLIILLAAGFLSFTGWFLSPVLSATGLTVTVNRTDDGSDRNPGDGICDASVNLGEQCTLRAAIEELNAQGASTTPHQIMFGIPGTGPFTITPGTELPLIRVPVEIDGATQPGASCPTDSSQANLMILLDGSNAGTNSSGLVLHTGSEGSTIRGLVIGHFDSTGIWITSNGNLVACNHLGIGTDGETALGNGFAGIVVSSDGNTIGGHGSVWQRNVLSRNMYGILIIGNNNTITNNFTGTTAAGNIAAGNSETGIIVIGNDNFLGGTQPMARNVISSNGTIGLQVSGGDRNLILGNLIGLAADGVTALGNRSDGVLFVGNATGNQVGGTASGEGNVIVHNASNGVNLPFVDFSVPLENAIRGNTIYENGGLGIDLGDDGITSNDPGDSDSGANELQNNPVLVSSSGSTIVAGSLDSQPNTSYVVDVYRSTGCDPSGYGEGQQYLGTRQVTTNSSGQATFEVDLAGQLTLGDGITVSATDPNGNTSEFSNCVILSPSEGITLTVTDISDSRDASPGDYRCDHAPMLSGDQCSLRAAVEEINALGAHTTPHHIVFDIPGSGPHTLNLQSQLPEIVVPVVIDGTTQSGATCPTADAAANLMIVIDGSGAGTSSSGLVLGAGSEASLIRGLVIGNFNSGVWLRGNASTVQCSYLGISEDGVTAKGNVVGILISGSSNDIGGQDSPNQRNVISGNNLVGVYIRESAVGTAIYQNYIGTTADGMRAQGNQSGGMNIEGRDSFIIGAFFTGGMNLISGNAGFGIRIDQGDDNVLLNSYIGVARDGITALPNGGHGIEIIGDATDNEIGGPVDAIALLAAQPANGSNRIANNTGHGIALIPKDGADPAFNLLRMNAIFDNAGLGIDLGDDGVDENDPGDSDEGANRGQNYPVLTRTAGSPVVMVTLDSQSNTEYEIDLYRSPTCDPSGYGEGQGYLDTFEVTTDDSGHASFEVDMTGLASLGDSITATAADLIGNTSEFSNCVTFIAALEENTLYLPIVTR